MHSAPGRPAARPRSSAIVPSPIETTAYEAFPPGTISTAVNGQVQSLTVASGQEVAFDFTLPAVLSTGTVPATFQTSISFLSPRVNPDAARGTITSRCGGDRSYTIPSGTTTTLNLNAFVASACTYTLSVGGRTVTLSQTQANNISLNRLDVNNVTITSDVGGPTTTTTGTYTLDFGGVQVAGPYTTPSGVDVLPGTYGFVLNFTDVNGAETQSQTLTF
jgi:hypothetical protein